MAATEEEQALPARNICRLCRMNGGETLERFPLTIREWATIHTADDEQASAEDGPGGLLFVVQVNFTRGIPHVPFCGPPSIRRLTPSE